jgi:hypothetical protein
MSSFVTKDDYKPHIRDNRLEQLIDQDDMILDQAEEDAIQIVKDALVATYDLDAIFSQTGADRKRNVLRWGLYLAVYFLYERIPDAMVPERVIKNYDDTREILHDIADGKRSVDLPKQTQASREPTTKFRWGALPPRTHI